MAEHCLMHGERETFTAPHVGYTKEPGCTCTMLPAPPMTDATELDEAGIAQSLAAALAKHTDFGHHVALAYALIRDMPVIERLLAALDEARAENDRLVEQWDDSGWASPEEVAVLTDRAEAAEAKVKQWRERMWATVNERAVWRHDLGEHSGDLPFMPCPSCERDVHAARAEAAESALAAVRALRSSWWSRAMAGSPAHQQLGPELDAALATPTTPEETR